MALPASFSNATQYFETALDFLQNFAWIYEVANTRIISENVLEKIPENFKKYFLEIDNDSLNQFPFVHEPLPNAPNIHEVQQFREQLAMLIPKQAYEVVNSLEDGEPPQFNKKLNRKKQHEISKLSAYIDASTNSVNTPLLIDFGAGLGYLSEKLYGLNPNFHILGLEADAYRVQAARQRCATYLPTGATQSINYQQHFINAQSEAYIETQAKALLECRELPKMCIIGLHACADLSIDSIKLFLNMPQVKRLIIMPCCYHKLQIDEVQPQSRVVFKNFPLSAALRTSVAQLSCGAAFLNRPFLRLACQQTAARWRDTSAAEHHTHGRQMYVRALAEAILGPNESVSKLKVSQTLTKSTKSTTEPAVGVALTFEADLCATYALQPPHCWSVEHERRFNELNARYGGAGDDVIGPKLAEALTCLQTAMQKLCENIVLYDRLCFMEESAVPLSVSYKKLLDEKLSPRCFVLHAEKLTSS